jgi:hypothetical protein
VGVGVFAGLEVDHARLDAAGEEVLDLARGHARLAEAGDGQDAALLVELAVLDLHRLERHRRAGDEHRADEADRERHQQRAARRFFLGHCARASA